MVKVPDLEIIDSVLNKYFSETEVGGFAEEDSHGSVYVKRNDGSLYAYLHSDAWFELLEYKKENGEDNA